MLAWRAVLSAASASIVSSKPFVLSIALRCCSLQCSAVLSAFVSLSLRSATCSPSYGLGMCRGVDAVMLLRSGMSASSFDLPFEEVLSGIGVNGFQDLGFDVAAEWVALFAASSAS